MPSPTGPSKGVVNIDPSGTFRYVPNVEARWGAKATSDVDTDSFSVTASDGNGGSTTFNVSVTIAPPSTAASAIDQRGTTVAMNVQEMYFYSQAETDRALDLLKADGVDTDPDHDPVDGRRGDQTMSGPGRPSTAWSIPRTPAT